MAAIPDDKVQEVRDRVDIVDLIGRYVELRRAGQNWKGLCPFHGERTPSFNVNPARKGYKCFGCGAGGDALRFVMELEGKSFPEAVRKLAEIYGVSLPVDLSSPRAPSTEKDDAYALTALATRTWQAILEGGPEGETGRAYVRARGIDDEVVASFRLGYAPAPSEAGWDRLARAIVEHKLSLPMAERLGLVGKSEKSGQYYDKLRGRLIFPVIAPGGEVVAFSGRIVPPHDAPQQRDGDLVPTPKYVNSPESLLYSKGKTLFGLHAARPALSATRRAVLVEGNLDVVRLHQWGYKEAIAPLGTALTADQAKLLARFCDQVVMAFDGDSAGKKAAWSALPLLLEVDLDVRMVLLQDGEDPDSIGPARMASLLLRPETALVEMMKRMAQSAGDAVDARARALDRILPLVARAPRESQRQLYADRAAELFDLPPARVEAALRQLSRPDQKPPPKPQAPARPQENSRNIRSTTPSDVPVSAAVRPLPLPAGQSQLAMLLVDVPHLATVAERSGALEWIRDERLAPIARAVIEGARRGEHPGMSELLTLVEPDAQPQVHDKIFAGEYRSTSDPQTELTMLLQRCELEALESEISAFPHRIRELQARGLYEEAVSLQQQSLQTQRRLAELSDPRRRPEPQPN
ncbi:MAG: DNA primase [Deltaproteobacteria bacterium]|nr:DNA primase [Nannocystaceae bacterium]